MTETTRDLPDELRRFLEADPERLRAFEDAAWYEELRRRLVSLRRDRELSQKDVAERAGCHQSEISRLENGLGDRTRIGSLRRYVEACGGRLNVLVDSATTEPPTKTPVTRNWLWAAGSERSDQDQHPMMRNPFYLTVLDLFKRDPSSFSKEPSGKCRVMDPLARHMWTMFYRDLHVRLVEKQFSGGQREAISAAVRAALFNVIIRSKGDKVEGDVD